MSTGTERQLQRRVLEALNQTYPAPVFPAKLRELLPDFPHEELPAILQHLTELELANASLHVSSDGSNSVRVVKATITARGRDFLKEGGGLAAELDVVTVRLHADTIRDLLAAYIAQSDLDSSAKRKLTEAVKTLPAKGLEEAVTGLAREGLARWPAALQWLQTLTGL